MGFSFMPGVAPRMGSVGWNDISWLSYFTSLSRSPYGERGLECYIFVPVVKNEMSLPVWGAWVGISMGTSSASNTLGRSPYGERGLEST